MLRTASCNSRNSVGWHSVGRPRHLTLLTSWEYQSILTRGKSTHSFRLNYQQEESSKCFNCKCTDLMLIWTNTPWWAALCKFKSQQQTWCKITCNQNAWKKTGSMYRQYICIRTSRYFVCSAVHKSDFTTLNGDLIQVVKGKLLDITWNFVIYKIWVRNEWRHWGHKRGKVNTARICTLKSIIHSSCFFKKSASIKS